MNSDQESENSRNKQVKTLFETNTDIIATQPKLVPVVKEFNDVCDDIDVVAAKQSADLTGLRVSKVQLHDMLVEEIVETANYVTAYAVVEKKPELKSQASVSASKLNKLADTKLTAVGISIADLADANADLITDYGFTPDVTTHLRASIKTYDKAIPQPKLGITETANATENLGLLFDKTAELLTTADAIIALMKKAYPDFFNTYTTLRKIVNYGRRKLAMQIFVIDAATGARLAGTHLIVETAETEGVKAASGPDLVKVVKKASAQGGSNIKTLAEGKYIITASRPGYITQTITVNVVKGEFTKVNIELVKE